MGSRLVDRVGKPPTPVNDSEFREDPAVREDNASNITRLQLTWRGAGPGTLLESLTRAPGRLLRSAQDAAQDVELGIVGLEPVEHLAQAAHQQARRAFIIVADFA